MLSISIIEDNPDYGYALQQIIAKMKNTIFLQHFTDAETAIVKLPQLLPDMVIVDNQLTGKLTGIDLIRILKPKLETVQFLVCSTYDDDHLIFDALRSGATGYILKDSNSEEIQNAILEVINGGAPMSPYIARQVILSFREKLVSTNEKTLLTSREKEVLQLLSKGLLYKEIVDILSISHGTVKKHIRNIYDKFHVQNKVEAINKFRRL